MMARCQEEITPFTRAARRFRISYQCPKAAKVEHKGRAYCGIHDPVARESRRVARLYRKEAK